MPYTSHGHWYGNGWPTVPEPRLVSRCGGPKNCDRCRREATGTVVPIEVNPQVTEMLPVETMRTAISILRGEPQPEPHPVRLPPPMPDVYAAPIAVWLASEATRFDMETAPYGAKQALYHDGTTANPGCTRPITGDVRRCQCFDHPLAVARAITGEARS